MLHYDLIVSSVHARRDLLDRTLRSLLPRLDRLPVRVLVHEDVQPDLPYSSGESQILISHLSSDFPSIDFVLEQTSPGQKLGLAMLWLFEHASTDFVLYTQEDFDTVRDVPVGACLDLVSGFGLNHVRFNKRKTMAVKGAHLPPEKQFKKIEVTFGDRTLCVSDHWYFQLGLWRRSIALEGFRALAARHGGPYERCEAAFNHWFNTHPSYGKGADSIDGEHRRRHCGTYIWGPIKEPAFIQHTGGERRSQGWETTR